MLTVKQNLKEVMTGGHPDRFVNQYEFMSMVMDPIMAQSPRATYGGPPVVNAWGVTNQWPEGTPGGFPVHTPDKIVIKDITHWEDYVHAPRTKFDDAAWEPFIAMTEKIDRENAYVTNMVAPGLFEQTHHLSEIQNALINFYEEPEHVHDLIKYLRDYELELASEICSHTHPDAIFHHDDWGSQRSTFLSPAMFDDFYLDAYKEVYGYYKAHGVELIVHHSDSYAATLVPEMIEMGIDIWQGVMTSNNIPELIKQYGGKISFMGGIDSAAIDYPGWTREVVRAEVRKACDACGKLYFIPGASQGLAMSTFPGVYEATTEEIAAYSKEVF